MLSIPKCQICSVRLQNLNFQLLSEKMRGTQARHRVWGPTGWRCGLVLTSIWLGSPEHPSVVDVRSAGAPTVLRLFVFHRKHREL